MNTTNPFVPQRPLSEQKDKTRARVKVAVLSVLAFNILVITPLLIQGCKRDTTGQTDNNTQVATETTPPPPGMDLTTATPPIPTAPSTYAPVSAPAPATAPQAPISQPTTPTGQATEYVIIKNDNLAGIAKKFPGVTIKDIENANPEVVPTRLRIGSKLIIPAPSQPTSTASTGGIATEAGENLYVVKSGDNLSKIAGKYGTTAQAIRSLNNLRTDRINVGQRLKLPVRAVASVPTPLPPTETAPAGTLTPAANPSAGTIR